MKHKIVNYKGFEWYVLKESEESVTLFMKGLLSEEIVKNICDDTEMFMDNHIAHIKDEEEYDWDTSYVREVLNDQFLKKYLDEEDLIKMDDDYVRLLKLEELKWDTDIFKANDWYWLMTKMGHSRVAFVSSSGRASDYNAGYHSMAVRPVIELKKSSLEIKKLSLKNF